MRRMLSEFGFILAGELTPSKWTKQHPELDQEQNGKGLGCGFVCALLGSR